MQSILRRILPYKFPEEHNLILVQAGDSDTVILKFDDFNIEPAENCEFDSLTISNKGRLQRHVCFDIFVFLTSISFPQFSLGLNACSAIVFKVKRFCCF